MRTLARGLVLAAASAVAVALERAAGEGVDAGAGTLATTTVASGLRGTAMMFGPPAFGFATAGSGDRAGARAASTAFATVRSFGARFFAIFAGRRFLAAVIAFAGARFLAAAFAGTRFFGAVRFFGARAFAAVLFFAFGRLAALAFALAFPVARFGCPLRRRCSPALRVRPAAGTERLFALFAGRPKVRVASKFLGPNCVQLSGIVRERPPPERFFISPGRGPR